MNLDNDFLKQFKSELLFESIVEGINLFIFDNGINYVQIPSYTKLTLSASKKLRLSILEFYDGKDLDFCNIIEFKLNADIDPNAREWGAKRPDEVTSVSDAMVIVGMAQKIIANFYLKVNRPKKPTKFFNTLEDSISWSLEQFEKRKMD